MNPRKKIAFYLMVTFSIAGCKYKPASDSMLISEKGVDIYFAGATKDGDGKDIATYWKNGIAVKLASGNIGSYAYGITVRRNDVYVAGSIYSQHGQIATYWKNGVATKLTDGLSKADSGKAVNGAIAFAIELKDNDVYVVGITSTVNNRDVATYWKNGIITKLTDGSADAGASDILINKTDVYIVGSSAGNAMYWKNDMAVSLDTKGFLNTSASTIAISGEDIYVAGTRKGAHHQYFVTLWKNGKVSNAEKSFSFVHQPLMMLNGPDLYLTGDEINTRGTYYWKNNVGKKITDDSAVSVATALAMQDKDVYLAGYNSDGAMYWKNGLPGQLAKNIIVNAIDVVPK
jgi:hypothetical protein